MFDKDKSGWGGSTKKEKKVKSAPKKSEGKKLFGGDSFGKSSFGGDTNKKSLFARLKDEKSESFGAEKEKQSLFGKSKDSSFGSNNEKASKHLKWWHILLIVLGALTITVSIIAGVIIGKINDMLGDSDITIGDIISGIGGGEGDGEDDGLDDSPVIEGVTTFIGTFLPNDAQEYVLCEYTEYFSGETTVVLQKLSDMKYDCNAYYQLISPKGVVQERYSGEYTGEKTPEELKVQIYEDVKNHYNVNDEYMTTCSFVLYQPVSFTRVVISSATIAEDGNVSIKYSAGAIDGEMSEEYELIGTYTKTEGDFTFSYTNLPEDENLLCMAEKLLGAAKYDYYAQYGSWVNKLTFGDGYALYLTTPAEETPEA